MSYVGRSDNLLLISHWRGGSAGIRSCVSLLWHCCGCRCGQKRGVNGRSSERAVGSASRDVPRAYRWLGSGWSGMGWRRSTGPASRLLMISALTRRRTRAQTQPVRGLRLSCRPLPTVMPHPRRLGSQMPTSRRAPRRQTRCRSATMTTKSRLATHLRLHSCSGCRITRDAA